MPESTNSGVDADVARYVEVVHGARLWLPVLRRVFGVEPGFDRIAARRRRLGIQVATVGD